MTIRVLVVDDEHPVRRLLRKMLEKAGMEVVEADGKGALPALHGQQFDLVLVDLFMPDCDGIELIRQLRSVSSNQKIVAMSGGGRWNNMNLLPIARQLGANAALPKPFEEAELLATINRLFA
jgi:CheY-like chemotaxis protein